MIRRRYHRSGGIYHDGYLYVTRVTKNNIRYLKCSKNRHFQCRATGKVHLENENDFILVNGNHNHPREENRAAISEFRDQLRDACIQERGTLKNIYDRVALRNVDAAVEVSFNTIRCSMLNWRRGTTPNVPATLPELVEILQTGEWPRFSNCTGGRFFSGMVEVNGHSAVVFANSQFVENFRDSQHLFIDGTFKAVPRRPNFGQILTIFATCMDHAFPVVHVFMERRTKVLYDAVFEYLVGNFPSFVNANIVTDYELPLVQSLRNKFPAASLHGCFFHYCQAVLKKAKALGIVQQIDGNANGRLFLRKYYCLALLPADRIEPTLVSLQHDLDFGMIFERLNEYIRRQWIERVTAQHFSVFRQRHRTNNVMEAYHRRLNSKLSRHPGVWDLMETLIDVQDIAFIELAQLERHNNVFRIARRNVIFDARLNAAWDKLSDNRFTVGDFLRQAIHFVEGLDGHLHQWNEDEAAPDEEEPVVVPIDNFPELLAPAALAPPHIPNPVPPQQRPALPQILPLAPNLHSSLRPLIVPTIRLLPSPPPLVPISQRSLPPETLSLPSSSRQNLLISTSSFQSLSSNPSPELPSFTSLPRFPVCRSTSPNLASSPEPDGRSPSPSLLLSPEPASRSPSPSLLHSPESASRSPSLSFLLSPEPGSSSPSPNLHLFPEPASRSPSSNFPAFLEVTSRSPSPEPVYNFPPIPEAVAQAFARWDDDEDLPVRRWEPVLPAVQLEEEGLASDLVRCKICQVNQMQYRMECGHMFCSTCTARLFNSAQARCGVCRADLDAEPRPVYF